MTQKKIYFPLKVLLSYLALALLVALLGYNLYVENNAFKVGEKGISSENNKMIKVSNLLSNLYKTESFARIALSTNQDEDLKKYIAQTDSIYVQIDSIKSIVQNAHQKQLLDSVKYLISIKIENIEQLKSIKNETKDEATVKIAIEKINIMKSTLRKLDISDFVKDPSKVNPHQMRVIRKYVEVMNQNIPDDETNTLSQKALDSMLNTSRAALNDVINNTSKRREILLAKEKQLIQNELAISEQLTTILATIEKEIVQQTALNNIQKEQNLKKTNQTITYSAVIGFILTIVFSLMLIADFTKSQKYRNALEIANAKTQQLLKSREQLISTVSHDIKTPLSTIVGYTELLGNSELSPKQKNYTRNIQNSSNFIANLVRDLLELTKMEAGKFHLDNIPFSLLEIINEVTSQIQAIHQHKNIDLAISVEQILNQKIIGDPFRLKQILTNIIGNAYKFTDQGKITIHAYAKDTQYIISIRDTGIGIKKEHLTKIFDEFTQADDQIEKKFGGTGLGLTIAKKLTEAMNGKIQLESVYQEGSTFTLQFPLQISSYNTEESENSSAGISVKNIIILDDNPDLLYLIEEMMLVNDINCHKFIDPTEAINALKINDYDCILTDIQMPKMDGFQFLKNYLNNQTIKHRPVIAMTGRADLDEKVYQEAGFFAVIQKPFTVDTLNKVLNSISKDPKFDLYRSENLNSDAINWNSIKEFLSNDQLAISDFITSLQSSTTQSLLDLEQAIIAKDHSQINKISHRMNPIFKQIQANEVSKILQSYEVNPENSNLESFNELKKIIENLFENINLTDTI